MCATHVRFPSPSLVLLFLSHFLLPLLIIIIIIIVVIVFLSLFDLVLKFHVCVTRVDDLWFEKERRYTNANSEQSKHET